jgi:hypothetical protein
LSELVRHPCAGDLMQVNFTPNTTEFCRLVRAFHSTRDEPEVSWPGLTRPLTRFGRVKLKQPTNRQGYKSQILGEFPDLMTSAVGQPLRLAQIAIGSAHDRHCEP